jgi:hypothetical protein
MVLLLLDYCTKFDFVNNKKLKEIDVVLGNIFLVNLALLINVGTLPYGFKLAS